jgi:hypothetical protein
MQMQHQEGLLTMIERGEFTSTKVRNTLTVKANIVIFATSNSTERLNLSLAIEQNPKRIVTSVYLTFLNFFGTYQQTDLFHPKFLVVG